MTINLLGRWPQRLQELDHYDSDPKNQLDIAVGIPLPQPGEIQVAGGEEAAEALIRKLSGLPVRAIGVHVEVQHERAAFRLKNGPLWRDIRGIRPLFVSLCVWVDDPLNPDGPGILHRHVIDLRNPAGIEATKALLNLRVKFVFHDFKKALFALWSCGIDPVLHSFYDTHIAAAAQTLGLFHARVSGPADDSPEHIAAKRLMAEKRDHALSLAGQCAHYKLGFPYGGVQPEAQSPLPPGVPMPKGLIDSSAAPSEWTLRLYHAQQPDIEKSGISSHLHKIEFPFIPANARMEWTGVHITKDSLEKLTKACTRASDHYAINLKTHGLDSPDNPDHIARALQNLNLIHHFKEKTRAGRIVLTDKILYGHSSLHPAVGVLLRYRAMSRILTSEWIYGALRGKDGRHHPAHLQLATATSRNSCKNPNLGGIDRNLRPVVTAPPEMAIFELDYSQMEIGVVAAEFNDPVLISAYNQGDVYAVIAQKFYKEQLTAEEINLDPTEFKNQRKDLRDNMKIFVLAVIYNMQPRSISLKFGISESEARKQRERFMDMFPVIKARLDEEECVGLNRGFATTVTGLRRYIPKNAGISPWVRNFLRNTPIQGSAASVFKRALILLDQEFRETDVKLIFQLHDAVLIECPEDLIIQISDRAKQLLEQALREFYPVLNAKVDVNRSHPWCWNKDGKADSLERLLKDSAFNICSADTAPNIMEEDNDE
ncbi:DNA polymerase [Bdellovibrionota bacterium FG-1]